MYPGVTAQVPTQTTTVVHLQLQDEDAEARQIHDNNNNMDAALKTMLLEEVEST